MILLGEGGENEFNTNLNFLLEEYGMTINNGKFRFFVFWIWKETFTIHTYFDILI